MLPGIIFDALVLLVYGCFVIYCLNNIKAK